MRFTDILTATDLNPNYYKIIPVFIKTWLHIFPEINIHIILIANEIIEELKPYEKYIKLFKPIEGINTALTAQYIRILYPSLLTETEGGIMITDMDMLPMGRKYYIKQIENITDDKFICYRPLSCVGPNEMVICYNIAHSNIWRDIFKVYCEQDIINILTDVNKNNFYEGKHGGKGWNLDQLHLYSKTQKWNKNTNNLIILSEHINEIFGNNLPKRNDYYVRLWRHYNIHQIKYFLEHDNIVDFHLPKPYNKEISDKVLELLYNKKFNIELLKDEKINIQYNRKLLSAEYGTHMAPLINAVINTTGDVFEMGCGDYSTPILHYILTNQKRNLLSTDTDKKWLNLFVHLENEYHKFQYVDVYDNDWDLNPKPWKWDEIGNKKWSVVFIDHRPGERRKIDIERFKNSSEIIVIHDTEQKSYGYDSVIEKFKYKYTYKIYNVYTTLVSNFKDVYKLF